MKKAVFSFAKERCARLSGAPLVEWFSHAEDSNASDLKVLSIMVLQSLLGFDMV